MEGAPTEPSPCGEAALCHANGASGRGVIFFLGRREDPLRRGAGSQTNRLHRLASIFEMEDRAADEGARIDDKIRYVKYVGVEQLVPDESPCELIVRAAGDDLTSQTAQREVVKQPTQRVGAQNITRLVQGCRRIHGLDSVPPRHLPCPR